MRKYLLFLILGGPYIYFTFISFKYILIGKGKLNDPMYDSIEKKRYIFKKGIAGLICNLIIVIPCIVFVLVIFF